MQRTMYGLSRPTGPKATKSHEDIERELAEFEARGGEVQPVPGFTKPNVRPRASYSLGHGAGAE